MTVLNIWVNYPFQLNESLTIKKKCHSLFLNTVYGHIQTVHSILDTWCGPSYPNLPYSIYCLFVFDIWLPPSTWSLHMMFNSLQVSNQNRHTMSQIYMNRRQIEWGKKDNSICQPISSSTSMLLCCHHLNIPVWQCKKKKTLSRHLLFNQAL